MIEWLNSPIDPELAKAIFGIIFGIGLLVCGIIVRRPSTSLYDFLKMIEPRDRSGDQ